MKPATDLCSNCQRYVFNIKNAGNLSEEEKRSLLDDYSSHLDKAKGQREFYRDKCIESKALFRRYNLDQIEQGKYLTNIFGLMDGWIEREEVDGWVDGLERKRETYRDLEREKLFSSYKICNSNFV